MKAKAFATALMLYGAALNGQENLKQPENSWLESIGEKILHSVEDAVESGANFFDKKMNEARLENQIQQMISYEIPDQKTRLFAEYLGLEQKTRAYVTEADSLTAKAKVYFDYEKLDNLAFAQNYEFSLKNGNIESIISKGNRWIDIDGKGMSFSDGIKLLHLYDIVTREWDAKKAKYETENPGLRFFYERVPIEPDNGKAVVEIVYYGLDKFGNKVGNKVNRAKQEYFYENGEWKYWDTNYFEMQKNPPMQKEDGILKKGWNSLVNFLSDAKKELWGD